MIFTNTAALSYLQRTVSSNVVTGEVSSPLTLQKVASADTYAPGERVLYTVAIVNRASAAYDGLLLEDDLGLYLWNGTPRFPMSYTIGSAALHYFNASGITPGTVTAEDTAAGVTFSFGIPALSTALLSYEVTPTPFAPLSAGSAITNTAVLSGNVPLLPLTASHTLPIAEAPDLAIAKASDQAAVVGQPMRFYLIVSNYGNLPVTDSDFVTLSDSFDPPLRQITVRAGETLWTQGVEYLYDENFFFFQTLPGALNLPAAAFSQDSFGLWNASPASLILTVTGTVASRPS